MRSLTAVLVLASFMIAGSANATHATFSASGTYLAGSPVSYGVIDACGNGGLTEGIDSNCVAVPAGFDGHAVAFTVSATGPVIDTAICWYDSAGNFLACDNALVPANSASVAFATLGGVNVSWTMTVS